MCDATAPQYEPMVVVVASVAMAGGHVRERDQMLHNESLVTSDHLFQGPSALQSGRLKVFH